MLADRIDNRENMNQLERPNDNEVMPMQNFNNEPRNNETLALKYIVIIGGLSLISTLAFFYLLLTNITKTSDKFIIYILSSLVLTFILTTASIYIYNNVLTVNSTNPNEVESDKETPTLNENNVIEEGNINLDTISSDVTINTSGTYTFSGNFSNSIIVDASNEEVELVLSNVNITNENTAAIIVLNAELVTITLDEESENTLSDGGNSSYDGCIYSNSKLVFNGLGTLTINSNQSEGEGIATETQDITFNGGTYIITSNDDGINAGGDGGTITINDGVFYINAGGDGIDSNKDAIINGGTIFVVGSDAGGDSGIDTELGYTVNGGTLVALGTDMIETPTETSTQNTLAFVLEEKINANTIVTLLKDDESIFSFESPKSFKTIIISSDSLIASDYELYTGGSNSGELSMGFYKESNYVKGNIIKINGISTFTIQNTINLYN